MGDMGLGTAVTPCGLFLHRVRGDTTAGTACVVCYQCPVVRDRPQPISRRRRLKQRRGGACPAPPPSRVPGSPSQHPLPPCALPSQSDARLFGASLPHGNVSLVTAWTVWRRAASLVPSAW